jgi:hypothetical protein
MAGRGRPPLPAPFSAEPFSTEPFSGVAFFTEADGLAWRPVDAWPGRGFLAAELAALTVATPSFAGRWPAGPSVFYNKAAPG